MILTTTATKIANKVTINAITPISIVARKEEKRARKKIYILF